MIFTPNWCECDLRIEGEKEYLDKFKRFAQTTESCLDHNQFLPYPQEYVKKDKAAKEWEKTKDKDWSKRPKDGFNDGGYNWCLENWGTKWGICNPEITEESDGELCYTFETAWSPPCPIIKKMSEIFPLLKFTLK